MQIPSPTLLYGFDLFMYLPDNEPFPKFALPELKVGGSVSAFLQKKCYYMCFLYKLMQNSFLGFGELVDRMLAINKQLSQFNVPILGDS